MINNVLYDVKGKRFGSSSHWIVTSAGGIRAGYQPKVAVLNIKTCSFWRSQTVDAFCTLIWVAFRTK